MARQTRSTDLDLDFRPASYWAPDNPVSAIVQNIKGENRRRMARDFVTGQAPEALGEIHDELLADTMPAQGVVSLGQLHPSFMGGEYLPEYLRGEVEIVWVVLQSSTQDVFSLRGWRGRTPDARIRYRFLDECQAVFTLPQQTSARCLTMGEVIALLDGVESDDMETAGRGLWRRGCCSSWRTATTPSTRWRSCRWTRRCIRS